MTTLYNQLARNITQDIKRDIYRPGERLPGVRRLAQQYQVSIATVLEACRLLEDQGQLEARSRSGFFVRMRATHTIAELDISNPPKRPSLVRGQELALRLVKAANDPHMITLGAAIPHTSYLPVRSVKQAVMRVQSERTSHYEFPPGEPSLLRQIARRMSELGTPVAPDQIVITNGCQEALQLALRAITQVGDVVAVESPAYYGLLQVIEFLGLKALELPTHPRDGLSVEALEFALEQWPIKAVICTPNFSNPLGSRMSDSRKRALVKLAARKQIKIIEDDIYGDLGFDNERPSTLLSFDTRRDTVLHCSSFSKTLAPGLRIGWIVPGQFQAQIEYLKFTLNLATAGTPQQAVAALLEHGRYDRYLRQARLQYQQAVHRMVHAVDRYFPEGTKTTQPQGGFVLWVELGSPIDAEALFEKALTQNICIAPGPMFSATRRYRNFIRLNCAIPWDIRIEKALNKLGQLIAQA
ncbi:MAG: PLP-dependent aminotransferase family protein [Steroidobacteraceae bacterium]